MKLIACIITKDEERCILRCIDSFKPYVNSILVSDTGSRDNTVRLARGRGARIFRQAWENDFALARNFLLDEAGDGGWILFLDADEYFAGDGAKNLRRKLEEIDNDASYDAVWTRLANISPDGAPGESMPVIRAFRASKDIRYDGAVHEVLRKRGKPLRAAIIPDSEVLILHDGYAGMRLREKALRNIDMLGKPGAAIEDTRLYYLGRAYASVGKVEEALESYLEYLRGDAGVSPVTLSAIIGALPIAERMNRREQADWLTDLALQRFPEHPTAHILNGDRLFERCMLDGAAAEYRRAFELHAAPRPELEFSANAIVEKRYSALLRTAHIHYLRGEISEALQLLKEADISHDADGLALAARCLAGMDHDMAVRWIDSVCSMENALTLEPLLDALYAYCGGMLYLIYFERYFNLTGLKDERFQKMQIIVGEYSAAISGIEAQCLKHYSFVANDGLNGIMTSHGVNKNEKYDVLRHRMLVAALLSGNEVEIEFARRRFGMEMTAAIDLALGRDVDELPAGALEDCLGVFGELLRLGGFSGAARVWIELLSLFGDDGRLGAAELLDSVGLFEPALDLLFAVESERVKRRATFLALRICVRVRDVAKGKICAGLARACGCSAALFEQYALWAETL